MHYTLTYFLNTITSIIISFAVFYFVYPLRLIRENRERDLNTIQSLINDLVEDAETYWSNDPSNLTKEQTVILECRLTERVGTLSKILYRSLEETEERKKAIDAQVSFMTVLTGDNFQSDEREVDTNKIRDIYYTADELQYLSRKALEAQYFSKLRKFKNYCLCLKDYPKKC